MAQVPELLHRGSGEPSTFLSDTVTMPLRQILPFRDDVSGRNLSERLWIAEHVPESLKPAEQAGLGAKLSIRSLVKSYVAVK